MKRLLMFVMIACVGFLSCTKEELTKPLPANDFKLKAANPAPSVDPAIVFDVDGNMYHTVIIGTQTWMVENLKTTRFNDGTEIPELNFDQHLYPCVYAPNFSWYGDDKANSELYGGLYNGYCVESGMLAPVGWHVPSAEEYDVLITYLNGSEKAGGMMKETGTQHWNAPNVGANNLSGFTGLPGGYRDCWYFYTGMGDCGFWQTSTFESGNVHFIGLIFDTPTMRTGSTYKSSAFSVRCIKN